MGERAAGSGASVGGVTTPLAVDVGVSAREIKLGVVLLDLGGLGAIGYGIEGLSPKEQQDGFQAEINALNAAGGFHGRQIKPVYERMDPIQPDSLRRVCVAMASDHKVFAVLNVAGFVGTASLCLTEEHGVPYLFHDGEPDEWYQRSKGLMFSMPASKTRVARNWVAELHTQGVLAGKRIGVVSVDFDTDVLGVERGLLPALAAHGYKVTHRSHLPRDLSVAASQTPIEVQQMRSKGVEVVLLTAGFTYSVPFVQEAESQLWFPQWTASDFAGMASDLSTSSMPRSFDAAIGYTGYRTGEGRTGGPEPAADARCRRRYEQHTGQSLDRNGGTYRTAMFACNLVAVFASGVNGAGPGLTRRALSDTLQSLGAVQLVFSGGGSFARSKFDAMDTVRTLRWRFDCRCWVPIDQFRRAKY